MAEPQENQQAGVNGNASGNGSSNGSSDIHSHGDAQGNNRGNNRGNNQGNTNGALTQNSGETSPDQAGKSLTSEAMAKGSALLNLSIIKEFSTRFDRVAPGGLGQFLFPIGITFILMLLLIPLPAWMLDILLAFSITFSLIILMAVVNVSSPSELNSFPTIILISALLRLGLNVSSTRLILSEGHKGPDAAGDVISAFGSFVVQGNYVIGVIIFAILLIINFVVITKGAGRVAEVAARFSLDALPGKQMAIDADLTAGQIDENEARKRREDLQKESSFHGAMDGASKFVRGDAIAGLVITMINIIGGIFIGTAQRNLELGEAVQTYTLLTIGDGLVSQVPALIISIAAGLLVTTSSNSKVKMDKVVYEQIGAYPMVLAISSVMLFMTSLVPGLPFVPFAILAVLCGYYGWRGFLKKEKSTIAEEDAAHREESGEGVEQAPPEQPISKSLQIDQVRLELGYGLLSLMKDEQESRLTDQIKALRRQLASDYGFVMPAIRIQDNLQLPANQYIISVKEIETGSGELRPKMFLAMDPAGQEIQLSGEKTREPTFGLPAVWIHENLKDDAMFQGYTVVDCNTIITTHLTEVIKDFMPELLTYSETQKLIDELPDSHKKLVEDMIPARVHLATVQKVLQNLLKEKISIRDFSTLLESINEIANGQLSDKHLSEHVRMRIGRQICHQLEDSDGWINVIALSPHWEKVFRESLVVQNGMTSMSPNGTDLKNFHEQLMASMTNQGQKGLTPALIVAGELRLPLHEILERTMPNTPVISYNEITSKAQIRTVDRI